ncbi:MAG TPA: FIST C-terminal domain-containing protein, partial [Acidimicrobiales bacterium]|nr:FIST C-terminal domain-containing protein [Acidimicrobiales bacterium]
APGVLLGCAAESVIGPRREVEQVAAVSLWAGRVGPVTPVRVEPPDPFTEADPIAALAEVGADEGIAVVVGDPFSFDAASGFDSLARRKPGLMVAGGMASAARGPGASRLVLGDRVYSDGAVAAVLGSGARARTLVSQGCRPIGSPWAVTRSEGSIIYELAGQPALDRLMHIVEQDLSSAELAVINRGGLHLGVVVDEHRAEFGPGDFLVRSVRGADRSNGAMAVAAEVEVGTTVQFHLQDAAAADEDLRATLAGHQASSALIFSCNGRGTRLFRVADHDADVVADALGEIPAAGFMAAGEFGPVGGRNHVHGLSASLLLLGATGVAADAS